MGGVCTGGTLKNGHGGVVLRSVKSFSEKKKSFNDHDDSVVSSSTSHGQDDGNDDNNEDVYHRKTIVFCDFERVETFGGWVVGWCGRWWSTGGRSVGDGFGEQLTYSGEQLSGSGVQLSIFQDKESDHEIEKEC
ncbi:hypothetical protein Tco_0813871 [Tanacetum coccineum]